MRIAHLSIRYYRGIKSLDWSPSPKLNCLIGPGDSCKTTILDAIEIAMTPRYGFMGSDSDIFDCDPTTEPDIRVTLVALPEEYLSDRKFGLHLRGWLEGEQKIHDEPQGGDLKALTVRAHLNPETLEWNWEVFNERVDPDDPPRFGLKDASKFAPSRLGTYSERHLTWGRSSALSRLEAGPDSLNLLAQAVRSARTSFGGGDRSSFEEAVKLTTKVGEHFLVPSSSGYEAQLDIQSGMLASGAVSLHDGQLPLRTMGSGSSRLMVAGLQHSNSKASISLIDEIELGLEPLRIMRLLRFLRKGLKFEAVEAGDIDFVSKPSQVFLTTHSPVVVCELNVTELYCVRSKDGSVSVLNVEAATEHGEVAQRHVRANPAAFLAPRIIIGEGRTEYGFLRGLDEKWNEEDKRSFAFLGVVAVDGGGNSNAPKLAKHLLKLGYSCLVLLDTDDPVPTIEKEAIIGLGGIIQEWPDRCDIERRIFRDVPWSTVKKLVAYAIDEVGESRVIYNMKKVDPLNQNFDRADLDALSDTLLNRERIAKAATLKVSKNNGEKIDKSWFKNMGRGEMLGTIVHGCLDQIANKPLALTIQQIRHWVDG